MAGRLTGRKILVSGGASGIGAVCASLMVSEGATVTIMDRNAEAAKTVANSVRGHHVVVDIRDASQIFEGVATAARMMGGLDGVVNTAGVTTGRAFADTDLETWLTTIGVNLTGTFLVCKACLPWLKGRKGSAIVNLASSLALVPAISDPAYMASKGGVISLSRALAAELAPDIRVNVVAPGATDTPLLTNTLNPAQVQAMAERYAMKRIARPEEIAQVILFLTSDDASYVTGATLDVDGGRSFH